MNNKFNRVALVLLMLAVIHSSLYGQSGRVKRPEDKPPVIVGASDPSLVTASGAAKSGLPAAIDGQKIYKGSELDQKVLVKKKPNPTYTREARKHQISGTVILRCVFASTGQVTNIHVVSGLPDGLTDRAIEAAQKIKFEPAMKDGKPVSTWIELQYNFNLY